MKKLFKETANCGKQIAINCNEIIKIFKSDLSENLNITQEEINISTNFYNPIWDENILWPNELYKFMIYITIKNKSTFLVKIEGDKTAIIPNHLINSNYPKKEIENIQNIILEILNN